MPLRDEYEDLFQYARTVSFNDAGLKGRRCMTSAVYAHYCNRSALAPFILSLGSRSSAAARMDAQECAQCLSLAHNFINGAQTWVCVYVGEVAISPKGRTAAKRFRHEFELCGYCQQAPALEALCAVMYESRRWKPAHKRSEEGELRTYLQTGDKADFLKWCEENVRCAWKTVDVHVDIAKHKVSADECALIQELKPLLNVKRSMNPFAPVVSEARRRFRDESTKIEI